MTDTPEPGDPSSPPSCWLALTTAPDEAEAERLAGALVEEELAACVNIVASVSSIYRWAGRTHRDAEVLVLVKTTGAALETLQRRLLELHPYRTPEFVAFEIGAGSAAYLEWVAANVSIPESGGDS